MAETPTTTGPKEFAFLGDSVFELLIREKLLRVGQFPVNILHEKATKLNNASAQAQFAQKILQYLTPAEMAIFLAGRNAHTKHSPKHQSRQKYRMATGLEALFGQLFLAKNYLRILEIFKLACEDSNLTRK
jgi:ribonuclease-3 family protein